MFHEWPAAIADLTVLPGVFGCRALRRTFSGTPRVQSRGTVARWPGHLDGLSTAIHETSGSTIYVADVASYVALRCIHIGRKNIK